MAFALHKWHVMMWLIISAAVKCMHSERRLCVHPRRETRPWNLLVCHLCHAHQQFHVAHELDICCEEFMCQFRQKTVFPVVADDNDNNIAKAVDSHLQLLIVDQKNKTKINRMPK